MSLDNEYLEKLTSYLPWYERKSKIYNELFKSVSIELQNKKLDLEDLKDQLDIEKATWGLIFWEIPFGIVPINIEDYKSRRALVKAKQQGYGKADDDLLKTIVKAFTGYDVDIEFNGRIIMDFKDIPYIDMTNTDLLNEIDTVKPAHLALDFQKVSKLNILIEENYSKLNVKFNISGETKTRDNKVHSNTENIAVDEEYISIKNIFNKSGNTKSKDTESMVSKEKLEIESEYIKIIHDYPIVGNFSCGGGIL